MSAPQEVHPLKASYVEHLQSLLNAGLDKLPRLGSVIRRDCLHVAGQKGLHTHGLRNDDDIRMLLRGLQVWETDRQLQKPDDESDIKYEQRVLKDAERLLATLAAEPLLDDELDGGWRFAWGDDGLDVHVDIARLMDDLKIVAKSSRQAIDGLSSANSLAPRKRARADPETYYARLILLTHWRYWMGRADGISNGGTSPQGALVDFMMAMIVGETPTAIEIFERRHKSKLEEIARRYMRGDIIRNSAYDDIQRVSSK